MPTTPPDGKLPDATPRAARPQTATCQVCKLSKRHAELLPATLVRPALAETIRKHHPDWSPDGFICQADLGRFRDLYIRDLLATEKGEITELEESVMESLRAHELLARNVNLDFDQKLSVGERLSDRIATFGGSWRFIITFGVVIVVWIGINAAALLGGPFDPYPFILLNLVLSCLAALQAPVIMMSQNRQEAKDRLRSEHDYSVNLKAELEIRHVNAKLDMLLTHQWQRLLEIQQVQLELMEELVRKGGK